MSKWLCVALAAASAGAGSALAQEDGGPVLRDAGVYLRAGGGVSFAQDLEQDIAYNPDYLFIVTPADTRTTSLGDGVSVSAAIGFQYPGRTRTELEYRYLEASVDGVVEDGGFDPASLTVWPVTVPAADTAAVHTLMSNVYVDFIPGGRVSPYIGVGVGGARVENGLGERDAAFAYQGRAGIDFALGGGVTIGAEYVYFRTVDVVYGPKEFEPGGPAGPRVDGAPFVSSSAMATIRKSF
ncbi:MAG: porin family protein [Parvularculaceae bacterium]|nr:porin family protein [Parvularculaceae bacterium]